MATSLAVDLPPAQALGAFYDASQDSDYNAGALPGVALAALRVAGLSLPTRWENVLQGSGCFGGGSPGNQLSL